jgi:nucleotide-binding universal stress UspA family protein
MNMENIDWKRIADITGVDEIDYSEHPPKAVDAEATIHEFAHVVDIKGLVPLNTRIGGQMTVGDLIRSSFKSIRDEVQNEVNATAITVLVMKAFGRDTLAACEHLMLGNVPEDYRSSVGGAMQKSLNKSYIRKFAAHIVMFLRSHRTCETDPSLGYRIMS